MGSGKLRVEGYGFLVEGGHTAMSVWVVWDTKWGRLPTSRETPCSTRKLYRVQGLGFFEASTRPNMAVCTWVRQPSSLHSRELKGSESLNLQRRLKA